MTQTSGGHPDGASSTAPERRERSADADPLRALLRMADGRGPDVTLLREALRCAGTEFGAVFALMKATHRGAALDDYWHSGPIDPKFWKDPSSRVLAQSIALGRSVEQRYRSKSGALRLAIIAAPIRDEAPAAIGGIALAIEIQDDARLERAKVELRAFATTLATLMRPRATLAKQQDASAGSLRAAAIAGSASDRTTVAIAMTNQLRAKLGCEQVALGVAKRKRLRLLAISGFADVAERTPGARAIIGAMEECFDLERAITTLANRAEDDACPLHRHWSAEADGACVATIPLRSGGQENGAIEAILALRHAPGKEFTAEDLKRISDSVAPYAAGLRVAEQASRSLLTHAMASIAGQVADVRHLRGAVRLALIVSMAALCGWIALGHTTHHVSAKARIAPILVRQLTAPFEARIASASVMEGDRVVAGAVLFTLDTAALEVERSRLEAAVRSSEVEAESARSKRDHAMARLVTARGDVDRASLVAVERRIAEAVVHAPSDGIILRGDLRERVGAAVASGEPLLEFVPMGELRVLLDVPEQDVLHVEAGARAEFRPQARPDLTLQLEIERIRPAAEVHGAENVFVAEAKLATLEPWMRVGVEGVVRVDAGERPVWWTLFHRLIDAVRLRLWV